MADSTNPFISKNDDSWEISSEGLQRLQDALTDPAGNVYAFNHTESPLLISAAMARLSRRGDDMRITYLDEFAATDPDKAAGLIHRVVTAYGDDSVQQLIGVHLVVEDASNLLTKLLEWGRLAAYLEQSTRYIFYDQKDAQGRYKYHVPTDLDHTVREAYIETMDRIFDLYSKIVRNVTNYVRAGYPEPADRTERIAWLSATRAQACDAARPVLPVATRSTVGIFGSAQAIDSLIMHLLSEELPEARECGRQILAETRKVVPAFLERTDLPERGGATTAYRASNRAAMHDLASQYLQPVKPSKSAGVKLMRHWPGNEDEIIAEMLFEQSSLPLAEIQAQVAKWPAKRKQEVFDAYVGERLNRRHKPGRAMELPHYEFEIVDDYGTFRDLQRHRMVDMFEWQSLTPDYGYEVPKLIAEAGYADDFRTCFKLSQILHKLLTEAGYGAEAQYATLLGHRMRYRFTLNARAAFHFLELRTSPQGHPGYRKIGKQMHDEIAKVHPRIAGAMRFVNQDEDPKLTRLAAERATQYKLKKLDAKKH